MSSSVVTVTRPEPRDRWPRPPGADPVHRLLPASGGPSYRDHLSRLGPPPEVDGGFIDEVAAAGLRGRGGAGFPTARKLAAVAERRGPAVLVANGTESEPLSAKDRVLLTHNPHLVLDGVAAAAAAVGAERAIVAIERSQPATAGVVRAALAERPPGPTRLGMEVVLTPSRYVAGQETALVSWINGGEARPRFAAPPYEAGVAKRRTLVDNVETLAHLGLIARFGADWFRLIGPPDEPGSMLATLAGGVAHPGVYEVPIGASLGDLLGPSRGRSGAGRPGGRLLRHLDGGRQGCRRAALPPRAGRLRRPARLRPGGAAAGGGLRHERSRFSGARGTRPTAPASAAPACSASPTSPAPFKGFSRATARPR